MKVPTSVKKLKMSSLYQSSLLFVYLLLIGLSVTSLSPANATITGDTRLYMPLVGRAEPALSEYIGLTQSQSPTIGNPTLPDPEIYTVRADGSTLSRLTDNDLFDTAPQWSPDGSLILWLQSAQPPGNAGTYYSDLWLMNTDGSNARNITNVPGQERGVWSPDGTAILILSFDGDQYTDDVYVTTPTALTPTLIISDTSLGDYAWSPDSAFFALSMDAPNEPYNLYRVNPDGTNITLLAEEVSPYFEWSPDSQWIAYDKTVEGNRDVYITRADSTETRRLTEREGDDGFGGWVNGSASVLVVRASDGNGNQATDLVSIDSGTITPFLPVGRVVGIASEGDKVIYEQVTDTHMTLFFRSVNSGDIKQVSPQYPYLSGCCFFAFGGWSDDEQEVTYGFYRISSPNTGYREAHVANLEYGGASYHQVGESTHAPTWLPLGSWISAVSYTEGVGNTLHLFNSRTSAKHALPLSDDGAPLIQAQWRYAP
jgi:Tol biopolymer transport system component